jgi:carboxyl-terminal processing protease
MPVSRESLNIVSPLEDSPAYRAGLQPEDKVLAIDGTSTKGKDVEECVDLLMGTPGTPVTLTIQREGKSFDITITREKIKTRSVKGVYRDPAKPDQRNHIIDSGRRIAYVRLTQFTPNCSEEVARALLSVDADKPNGIGGLVLDLRDNPGGVLRDAEQIADMFLKEGIIVSTRGRSIPEDVARARAPGTLPDFPMVVLIDGESASASEVLAGALVENNRALLVGSRSFGKGSVQGVLQPISGEGSELKLTQQAYYLPSGRNITRKDDSPTWGVDPSPGYFVPMTDEQTTESFLVRRRLDVINTGGSMPNATGDNATKEQQQPRWDDVAWILDTFKDPQLKAAVEALQGRIDAGEWKKTGANAPELGQIEAEELTKAVNYRERLFREVIRINERIDTLEAASAGKEAENALDFWANDIDLTGGVLEIKDKEGKVITTLKITGNDLERWLMDADVKKQDAETQTKPVSMLPRVEPGRLA